ncbi:hypothetical protein F5Y18DRAFT_164234 [Xylariaceae sp. FL1019]|nr:hypothetical protein F5Y18DRAFT_164234 [Xylariaceae sp. FL1019]
MVVHNISLAPSSPNPSSNTKHVLIFFISGNPGLIDYYEPFLSTLHTALDSSSSLEETNFHIYGQNLLGFSDDEHEPFTSHNKPYNLEQQIEYTLESLSDLRIQSGERQGEAYDNVLLIGHSVGSYIALELSHRVLRNPSVAPHLNLSSGIFLFPTIENIASSPSGWRLNMLRQTPLLGDNAYRIAQGFLRLWPYSTLLAFMGSVLGFPPHAAEVTTKWLKSRDGVWQALHLGMDEMQVIGPDKWDEELWAIEREAKTQTKTQTPKFYFFFGRKDHWVADHVRDAFIAKREKSARIMLDEGDLPHAFCIDHSKEVAEKVQGWIAEMYGSTA